MHIATILYKSFILHVIDYSDTVWNRCGRTNADNTEVTETGDRDYHVNRQE